MAASDNPNVTSPKVKAIDKVGGLGAIGLGVVAFVLTGLTPDLFPWLGPWAVLITGALVYAGARIAAYQTPDPLRENTLTQAKAIAGTIVRNGTDDPDVVGPEVTTQSYGKYEAGRPSDEPNGSSVSDPAAENWPDNKG